MRSRSVLTSWVEVTERAWIISETSVRLREVSLSPDAGTLCASAMANLLRVGHAAANVSARKAVPMIPLTLRRVSLFILLIECASPKSFGGATESDVPGCLFCAGLEEVRAGSNGETRDVLLPKISG